MKQVIISLLLVFAVLNSKSQTTSQLLASKIANKMKDSLSLTQSQRDSIYQVNIQLNSQKQAFRSQFSNVDSLRVKFQGVENTRDSLYHLILTSQEFNLYQQKKRSLVTSN
jgi:hypothetical protein